MSILFYLSSLWTRLGELECVPVQGTLGRHLWKGQVCCFCMEAWKESSQGKLGGDSVLQFLSLVQSLGLLRVDVLLWWCRIHSCFVRQGHYHHHYNTNNLMRSLKTNTISLQVTSEYCVDQNSVHQSGMSNGAMFSYIIATKTNRCPYNVCGACGWTLDLGFHRFDFEPRFASIGPVAGAPNLGYLEVLTSLSKVHDIVLNFYF